MRLVIMKPKSVLSIIVAASVFLALVLVVVLVGGGPSRSDSPTAEDFSATDYMGREFSLSDFAGNVTVLHITQLENPICIECEEYIRQQIAELATLESDNEEHITIVTLNIRKNTYSESGWEIARDAYNLTAAWYWVEEFEPFPVASQFISYWELGGGFANPTIVLIDQEQRIAAVHNVYCIGRGEVDGVVSASSLFSDSRAILSGDWDYQIEEGGSSTTVTFSSLFLLGVLTSFSPCSIALLMAMISYIGALRSPRETEAIVGGDMRRGVMIGLSFTMGMALVFFLMGVLIAYIGGFIELSSIFYLIAGTVLIILGINSIKPLGGLLLWLRDHSRREEPNPSCPAPAKGRVGRLGSDLLCRLGLRSRYAAAFLLGILFSVGWAPCAISLIFPVIVLVLSQQFTVITGGALMFVFGLGHGVVIVPFCAATGEIKGRIGNKYVSAGKWVQMGFGLAIIAIGGVFALRYAGVYLW